MSYKGRYSYKEIMEVRKKVRKVRKKIGKNE